MAGPEVGGVIFTALTRLMLHWTSGQVQAAIAVEAGVDLDPVDIPPISMLGMLGPVRPSVLADELRVSRPTVSKQLARLQALGLIERADDAGDARASIVALSPTGQAASDALARRGVDLTAEAIDSWTDADARRFAAALTELVRALGAPLPNDAAPGDRREASPTPQTPGAEDARPHNEGETP